MALVDRTHAGRRANVHLELEGVPELARALADLKRQAFPTANVRALNLVGRKMRTDMVRSVAKEMGIQQKAVRTRTKLISANRVNARVLLEFRGRAFNLIEFAARQTKQGVTARPWGQRRLVPHAFIATMPQGGRIVVIRALRGGRRVPRMPIQAWLGPGIAQTAAARQMHRERERILRDVYPSELRRQIDLLVEQKLVRAGRRGR